jgi:DNA primase
MEIRELKERIDILELAERLGIHPDRHGKALCPFHNDKNPSLQLSKEKQIATCFSANCDAGTMDAIGLTEKKLRLTTHEAIKWLEKEFHLNGQAKPTEDLEKLFRTFQSNLKKSERAKAYLLSRGLDADKTEIGYNATGWKNLQHCVVFPLKNKKGETMSLYGRSVLDSENRHFYTKNRQGLYPGYPPTNTEKLVLTESIIDAATMIQSGTEGYGVLACYGTNGLTEEIQEAIKGLPKLNEVIFFFDGDEAGKKGSERNAAIVKELLPQLKITTIPTPENEDINSLAVAHPGKEMELFAHLLEGRKPIDFSFSQETETAPRSNHRLNTSTNQQLNTTNPNKLIYATPTAIYHILGGLGKGHDSMKATLVIENPGKANGIGKYRTKLDLYEHKQVEKTAREAGELLNLRSDLLEIDLYGLTDLLEEHRDKLAEREQGANQKPDVKLSAEAESRCKEFLSKPDLVNRINNLIGRAGVVGEKNNRIFLFGIAVSYKMPVTLHALVQGSSGSGKTHLLAKVSGFTPQEDRKHFTRVTEGSFYNYGLYDLKNKLICLEDLDGMKEEAYLAFRELQSRGMISSSTSIKDENGNIRACEKTVYGPIASLSCTTKGEIYEDNMNRCFLIAVDESKEQTQKIIDYQNKKASGKIDGEEEKKAVAFLQNCVRMLKPHEVVNPYADKVNLPEEAHKLRRLNDLYQSYVKQVTLINQYRRKTDAKGRLISEKEDLQTAAAIMFDSIFLKVDELDGSLRMFYERLKDYVQLTGGSHWDTFSFTQREIRHALNISKTQMHRYMCDLINLEYIHVAGGYGNRGFKYKIGYWDNVQQMRAKIKKRLQGQLDQLELL